MGGQAPVAGGLIMAYDLFDFTESLSRVGIKREQIKTVIAAYGNNGGYSEWEGGFLMELHDGRRAHITGWCDTTGWGCQDGAQVEYIHEADVFERLLQNDHDYKPVDLNRWVNGEIET